MRGLTQECADALKDILLRDCFEMVTVEYPHLFMLNRILNVRCSYDSRLEPVQKVLINIRGKDHASYWMKGKREEFGIPAVEFFSYKDFAEKQGVPLYIFFYEKRFNMISFVSADDVVMRARAWEKSDIDEGGTLFYPKKGVIPLAQLAYKLQDGRLATRYINKFAPRQSVVSKAKV